jgi:hypothetical protein
MKKITKQTKKISRRFGTALALTMLLFSVSPVRAQYMSFFGDSTWKYQYTLITRPPEDYIEYPPETPNALGVYCITMSSCFSKNITGYYSLFPYSPEYSDQYDCNPLSQCHDHDGEQHPEIWLMYAHLYEDTVHGRLLDYGQVICDMSLSEGDTFVYEGLCGMLYSYPYGEHLLDPVSISMIVDSVRYLEGRKTIFLSLLDHLDDYFYGTGNHGDLAEYNLSIRFIEGIGPTYGLLDPLCEFRNLYNINHGYPDLLYYNLNPQLGLLQCMYKDDSLVYMAHQGLGCDQTCFGYQEVGLQSHPLSFLNLYPNPATQYVVLDMSTGEEMNGIVTITDMMGRTCLQQKAESTSCRISVADLPVGMYFCTYTDGKRKVTKKFLKE